MEVSQWQCVTCRRFILGAYENCPFWQDPRQSRIMCTFCRINPAVTEQSCLAWYQSKCFICTIEPVHGQGQVCQFCEEWKWQWSIWTTYNFSIHSECQVCTAQDQPQQLSNADEVQHAKQIVEQMERQLYDAQKVARETSVEVQEKQRSLDAAKEKIARLKQQRSQVNGHVSDSDQLRGQLEDVRQELSRAQKQNEEMIQMRSRLEEEYQYTLKEFSNMKTESKQIYQEMGDISRNYKQAQKQLEDMSAVCEQSNAEKEDLQQKREAAEIQARQMEAKVEELQEQVQQLQAAAQDEESQPIVDPLPDIEAMQAQYNQLDRAHSLLQQENEESQAEIKVLTQQRDETLIEINRIMAENDEIRYQAERIETDSAQFGQAQEIMAKLEEDFKQQQETQNQEKEKLQAKIKHHKEACSNQQDRIRQLELCLEEQSQSRDVRTKNEEENQAKQLEMQQAISELQEQLLKVEKEKEEIEKDKEEIENDRCIKIVEYDDLKKNHTILRSNSRSIHQKAEDLERQNSDLETKLDERNTSHMQLQTLIKNMKQSLAASSHDEKHIEKLKAEVKTLKMQVSMRENDYKILSKRLEQASNQDTGSENFENALRNMSNENNVLKAEIIQMQNDMQEQQTTVDNLYEAKALYQQYFALNQNLKEEIQNQRKVNREQAVFIEDQSKEIKNLRSERDSERDYEILKGSEDYIESSKSSQLSYEVAVEQPFSLDSIKEQRYRKQMMTQVMEMRNSEEEKSHSSPYRGKSVATTPTQKQSPTKPLRTTKPNFSPYKVMINSQRTTNIECQSAQCHKRILIHKNKATKCWMYDYWQCAECHYKHYGRKDPPESFLCAKCKNNY